MPKTYFNSGIVGNSGMLGCITDKGELVRLYWPHIDYPQHMEKVSAGIFFPGGEDGTSWLGSDGWGVRQAYVPDTNILETSYINNHKKLKVKQTDFVLPEKDVLVRRYELENMGDTAIEPGFMSYTSAVSTNPQLAGILFDFPSDSLIHYKYNYYISVSSDQEIWKFQLGNDAFGSADRAQLKGIDNIGMMPDGVLAWKLGSIAPGGKKVLSVYISAAHSLKAARESAKLARHLDYEKELENTKKYWQDYLNSARNVRTGNKAVDELYRRSILVFRLMSDKHTGGLLAAPEIDEEFTKCGRYAYCWGRDAAFITGAMDACGLHEDVDKFYRWAAAIQDEEGGWQQRYHMDGNLAPSWGIQIDETGTILWGILRHYRITGNRAFLSDMWACVRKGAAFLLEFMDRQTGLPWLSFDLWEERLGEHAYSTAAVYGGLMSAAEIGLVMGAPGKLADTWKAAAHALKPALERNFWKKDWHRFIRSVRVKLNPWGEEHSQDKVYMKINPKGEYRDFTTEDWTVDISLLGLTVPFGVYEAGHPMMDGTLEVLEQVLACPAGGLKRYENDNYAGGNPWLIAALWAALYHIEKKDFKKAREYFDWTIGCRTELGLLPEQADRETGKPAWVIPLTWSHAMFVLTLDGLLAVGEI